MKREWPAEALSFQGTVAKAIATLGGVDLARQAEAEPETRVSIVLPLLEKLDLPLLDLWGDESESCAVVLAVREAGAVTLPWPLNHQLAVPAELRNEVDGVFLASGPVRYLDHVDLFDRAVVADVDSRDVRHVVPGRRATAPLNPFGHQAEAGGDTFVAGLDRAMAAHHLLDAFWISGAVRSAVELASRHARDRKQFGVSIGSFGEIRWRLADMVVARDGLDEIAMHTWWLARTGQATGADFLALRLAALEAATSVLGHSHQVLGAMGLCEEHDLTVLDRHLQGVLRRPGGVLATTRRLADAIAVDGFAGTFDVAAWR